MGESNQSQDEVNEQSDALDSWEDGPAFGASEDKDPICETPVEEWIDGVQISSTEEVPIPEKLVDQVIGQEAASIVVRKAAEQRRHVIMVGEPGTGKSMLSRSMTEFLPREQLEDIPLAAALGLYQSARHRLGYRRRGPTGRYCSSL